MNIIASRREERIKLTSKLKATIQKAFNDNLSVDRDYLVAVVCNEKGTSTRYVREILKNLQISMGFTIENKQIIPPGDNSSAPGQVKLE